MEKENLLGTITICGYMDGSNIRLVVEDDGVGMDEETVRGIMNSSLQRESGGYKMRNIHHPLEIMFGIPYGLTVESTVGRGTRVTLRLPQRK